MALPSKLKLPDIYVSEMLEFQRITQKYNRTTTGQYSFTSASSGITYNTLGSAHDDEGETGMGLLLYNISPILKNYVFDDVTYGDVKLSIENIETNIDSVETNVNIIRISKPDTGTANAYVVNTDGTFSRVDGNTFSFIPSNTNTGASTMNEDGNGVATIKKFDITSNSYVVLEAEDIKKNNKCDVTWSASESAFLLAPKGGAKINGTKTTKTITGFDAITKGDFISLTTDELKILKARKELELLFGTDIHGFTTQYTYAKIVMLTSIAGFFYHSTSTTSGTIYRVAVNSTTGVVTIGNSVNSANLAKADIIRIDDTTALCVSDGYAGVVTYGGTPVLGTLLNYRTAGTSKSTVMKMTSTTGKFVVGLENVTSYYLLTVTGTTVALTNTYVTTLALQGGQCKIDNNRIAVYGVVSSFIGVGIINITDAFVFSSGTVFTTTMGSSGVFGIAKTDGTSVTLKRDTGTTCFLLAVNVGSSGSVVIGNGNPVTMGSGLNFFTSNNPNYINKCYVTSAYTLSSGGVVRYVTEEIFVNESFNIELRNKQVESTFYQYGSFDVFGNYVVLAKATNGTINGTNYATTFDTCVFKKDIDGVALANGTAGQTINVILE